MPKSRATKAASSEGLAMVNGTGCIAMCGFADEANRRNHRRQFSCKYRSSRRRELLRYMLPSSKQGVNVVRAPRVLRETAGAAGTHSLIHVKLPNTPHSQQINPHCTTPLVPVRITTILVLLQNSS